MLVDETLATTTTMTAGQRITETKPQHTHTPGLLLGASAVADGWGMVASKAASFVDTTVFSSSKLLSAAILRALSSSNDCNNVCGKQFAGNATRRGTHTCSRRRNLCIASSVKFVMRDGTLDGNENTLLRELALLNTLAVSVRRQLT
jgi:hypothetical protein